MSGPDDAGQMINRASGANNAERRSLEDRRAAMRRTGDERRQDARRLIRWREMDPERREEERRRAQRRGVYDRRSNVARRFTDRTRDVPSAFTPEETDEIRRRIGRSSHEIECPRCSSRLPVREPVDSSRPVWEIICETCNCAATITATSTAAVLVAADDAMMRDALSLALAKAGHRVLEADNGNAALRTYRTQVPDIVIADMSLGDMDGLDLMRRLLRFDNQARVIVMAGPRRHGAPDPLAMAKRLGATQILRRPFPPHEMLAAVGEVLRA